jgi:hypothetical protein
MIARRSGRNQSGAGAGVAVNLKWLACRRLVYVDLLATKPAVRLWRLSRIPRRLTAPFPGLLHCLWIRPVNGLPRAL